ncbi:MAG: hypothetical protein AB1465_04665 [Patescibacteria group bacterium]
MKINFGVSSCSRCYPGMPWEERIFEVPLGKLPTARLNLSNYRIEEKPKKVSIANYLDTRKLKSTSMPGVSLLLNSDRASLRDLYLYLIWIEEIEEWIVFFHEEWAGEGLYTDESEEGPYAFNDECRKILLTAYSLPLKLFTEGNISKISPLELEKMAKNVRQET